MAASNTRKTFFSQKMSVAKGEVVRLRKTKTNTNTQKRNRCSTGTLPSEAEDEKGGAKEGGHSVPERGGGPSGTEVETEPEGSSQGQQLACHKIDLE